MAEKARIRYNYFVAVHVKEEKLINELIQVQDEIIKSYPAYEAFRIPRNGFHVTLAVMAINSKEEERGCVQAVNQSEHMISSLARDCGALTFNGIGIFSPKVIFTHVRYSGVFRELTQAFRQSIQEASITVEDKPFNAHLTLFKVPQSRLRTLQLPKRLECGSLTGKDFGTQAVNNIHMCKMGNIECVPDKFCYEDIWCWPS